MQNEQTILMDHSGYSRAKPLPDSPLEAEQGCRLRWPASLTTHSATSSTEHFGHFCLSFPWQQPPPSQAPRHEALGETSRATPSALEFPLSSPSRGSSLWDTPLLTRDIINVGLGLGRTDWLSKPARLSENKQINPIYSVPGGTTRRSVPCASISRMPFCFSPCWPNPGWRRNERKCAFLPRPPPSPNQARVLEIRRRERLGGAKGGDGRKREVRR